MSLTRRLRPCCLVLFVLLARPASTSAHAPAPPTQAEWQEKKFELRLFSALGGPLGLANAAPYDESTPKFTWILGARAGLPRWTDLQIELNMVVPHGFGANLVWNAVHTKYFRLHLIDPGVFANVWSPVSAQNFKREADLTLGAGFDLRLWDQFTLTAGIRWYFANPVRYSKSHGHFMMPVYRESFQGGQVCFGASWEFWSF